MSGDDALPGPPPPSGREELAWEHRQKTAAFNHADARSRLLIALLTGARQGRLHPHWRQNVSLSAFNLTSNAYGQDPASPEAIACVDSETLACRHVADIDTQLWEPWAAHDWRTALDSWHTAILDVLEDDRRSSRELRHPNASPFVEASDRVVAAFPDHVAKITNAARAGVDAYLDRIHTYRRDKYDAWYRAGLAAGGETVDWIGWYRARIATWPDDEHSLAGPELALLDNWWHVQQWQSLPDYWTQQPK